jgi:hypothetical protein
MMHASDPTLANTTSQTDGQTDLLSLEGKRTRDDRQQGREVLEMVQQENGMKNASLVLMLTSR